jgi:hypothetical protein
VGPAGSDGRRGLVAGTKLARRVAHSLPDFGEGHELLGRRLRDVGPKWFGRQLTRGVGQTADNPRVALGNIGVTASMKVGKVSLRHSSSRGEPGHDRLRLGEPDMR